MFPDYCLFAVCFILLCNEASSLRCYYCIDCPNVDHSTRTATCSTNWCVKYVIDVFEKFCQNLIDSVITTSRSSSCGKSSYTKPSPTLGQDPDKTSSTSFQNTLKTSAYSNSTSSPTNDSPVVPVLLTLISVVLILTGLAAFITVHRKRRRHNSQEHYKTTNMIITNNHDKKNSTVFPGNVNEISEPNDIVTTVNNRTQNVSKSNVAAHCGDEISVLSFEEYEQPTCSQFNATVVIETIQSSINDKQVEEYLESESRVSTLSKNVEIRESRFELDQCDVEGEFVENRSLRVTIKDKHMIGKGCYGEVYAGKLYGSHKSNAPIDVAIKYASNSEWELYLEQEAVMLRKIGSHFNIIEFFDIDLVGNFGLITMLCENGDLKTYIKKRKLSLAVKEKYKGNKEETLINIDDEHELDELIYENVLSKAALIMYAFQIANGMRFINEKKVIHRDLALRNVLLTKEHIVKISDFGLAHDGIEYFVKNLQKPLPTHWLAPESLSENRKMFTLQSDVWTFGVTLWEIFSLGLCPTEEAYVPHKTQLRKWFLDGHRYSAPVYANEEINQLIANCWSIEPLLRPKFDELSIILSHCLHRESDEFHVYISNKLKNFTK